MSGSKILAFRKKNEPGPLETHLGVEDDRRLFRFGGAGLAAGLAFASWALTVELPERLPGDVGYLVYLDAGGDKGLTRILPPTDYHGPIKRKSVARHHEQPGRRTAKAPKPKTAHPSENPGWLGVNPLTSRGNRDGQGAYALLPRSLLQADLDKLGELPMLRRTPESRLSGRKGKQSYEFNLEYAEAGSGCEADCGPAALPEIAAGSLRARAPAVAVPSLRASSLVYASETNARSTASILAVIRAHAPGLRHIYNAHLKRNPGFAGKLLLRFAIAPSGDVASLEVVSSTTGDRAFDSEIARQVKSWRFEAVKAIGNDNVTVPFNFSE